MCLVMRIANKGRRALHYSKGTLHRMSSSPCVLGQLVVEWTSMMKV